MPNENPFRFFVKKTFFIAALILIAVMVFYAYHIFLLLFAAIMMAILWKGISRWLHKKTGIKESILLASVIIVNFGLIVLMFIVLAPKVGEQVEVLSQDIPKVMEEIQDWAQQSEIGRRLMQEVPDDGSVENPAGILQGIVDFLAATVNIILDFAAVIILSIFICVSPSLYKGGFLRLLPKDVRKRGDEVLRTLDYTLFRWFVGKIVDMTAVAILTAIGLWIIDIPLILTFSLIAFFFSFVPNIGPVIAAVPPILVSFLDDPSKAIYVALLYIGVQLIESSIITPAIQKKAITMPPVLLLLIQIFFAMVTGPLGLLLSTPILATAMILVKTLYVEDALDDQKIEVKGEQKL
ncbi:AI-2E family transporter [Cytophagaceae bacterium ABcell3]|nr:AI-2E family transporter [Cytophagaceae bacterium ABcell3]